MEAGPTVARQFGKNLSLDEFEWRLRLTCCESPLNLRQQMGVPHPRPQELGHSEAETHSRLAR
jgi:hypothetical protein